MAPTDPTTPIVPTPAGRLEGFLIGAAIGAGLAASTAGADDVDAVRAAVARGLVPIRTPAGRRRAPVALADALLAQLLAGGVDLRQLSREWVRWAAEDGLDADDPLRASLDHLRIFDAPLPGPAAPCVTALAAALPAALTAANPQSMIAGAFHVARLIDPSEATGLATVATVVAAARLLAGNRDFIPDVLAAMRANDAPADVIDAVARVPRDPRTPPRIPRGAEPGATDTLAWLLWTVHHRPRGGEALEQMVLAGGVPVAAGALLGALIGARDGSAGWPREWLEGVGEEVTLRRALARRLATASS